VGGGEDCTESFFQVISGSARELRQRGGESSLLAAAGREKELGQRERAESSLPSPFPPPRFSLVIAGSKHEKKVKRGLVLAAAAAGGDY